MWSVLLECVWGDGDREGSNPKRKQKKYLSSYLKPMVEAPECLSQ